MKKFLTMVLCLMLAMVMFVSCSQPAEEVTTPETTEEATEETTEEATEEVMYKIGLNSYAENFESSQRYIQTMEAAAAAAGNVELVFADCNADPQKVLPNYDAFIAQGVDAIIDASWLQEAGQAAATKAENAGIPLIVCDSNFDDNVYTKSIGTDQYYAGTIAGEYFAEYMAENREGEIDYLVLLYFQGGGENPRMRVQGVADGLAEAGVELTEDQVIYLDNEAKADKTNQIVRDFLTAHPDAKNIIFVSHNDPAAAGIVSAVKSSGREADCLAASFGGEQSALDILATDDEFYVGTVSFEQLQYGDYAIPAAIDLIEGREVPTTQGPTPFMIDRSNLG